MATLIKIDRNGSKHYEGFVKCDRCGGDGVYKWGAMISYGGGPAIPQYSGTCFKCGGAGKVISTWIERTPEYQAKLDAKREAKQQAKAAERAAEAAKREAERQEREAKWLAEKAKREQEEAARKAVSQYIGEVGEKISVSVTLERIVKYEVPSYSGYGTTTKTIYILVDANGNKLVWNTASFLEYPNRDQFTPVAVGDQITIRASIKAHNEYKGEKQTEIQRVKVA